MRLPHPRSGFTMCWNKPEQHELRKHEKMEEHMVTARGFVAKTLLADWPPCANMISVLS